MPAPEALERSTALIEQLNTWWRIGGPRPDDQPFGHRVIWLIRRAFVALLRPQQQFNSTVVQYVNTAIQPTIGEYQTALDQVQRFRESLAARERRMDAAIEAIRAEHEELRTSIGVLQQANRSLSNELERRLVAGSAPAAPVGAAAQTAPASDAMSHTYVGFEDHFRGSADAIRERVADYASIFEGTSDVLDIGCGRGEFLELLRERGVRGVGIDLNESMIEVCRGKNLDATRADALTFMRERPDGSLGGLFAAQVVEHLEPAYLTRLLETAFDKLRPGAPIVLETINPACWFAFFESYIRDITHVRALHPDTLKFLLVAAGFQRVEIRYRVPYPEHEKLQPVAGVGAPYLRDAVDTLNGNTEKLNRLLFTYLDYAAVGFRP